MSKNSKPKKKQLKTYARFSSLVIQMGIIIAGGSYFGKYLDSKSLSETPVYTIIFSLFAIALSVYYVLKELIKRND